MVTEAVTTNGNEFPKECTWTVHENQHDKRSGPFLLLLQVAPNLFVTLTGHILLAAFQHQMDGALISHGRVDRDEIRAAARHVLKLLPIYHQTHESGGDAALVFNQLFEAQHAQVLRQQEAREIAGQL